LDSWLRPIKLKELGGESARQKANRETKDSEIKESDRDLAEPKKVLKMVKRGHTTREILQVSFEKETRHQNK
jgi:hypothetical protein